MASMKVMPSLCILISLAFGVSQSQGQNPSSLSHDEIDAHAIIHQNIPALCDEGSSTRPNHTLADKADNSTIDEKCIAFYKSYVRTAGNFIDCELSHSRPFRICETCIAEYELTSVTYNDFIKNPDLARCRTEYMKADRVQIIPSMQSYIEHIWTDAACAGCSEKIHVNHCAGTVNFTTPVDIVHFIKLFRNLSHCLNVSLEEGNAKLWNDTDFDWSGNTSLCTICKEEYNLFNDHYDSMVKSTDGNICMDIVDRMNYTRLIWSHRLGCSCRSGEPGPVIAIAIIIGILPLFFYGILRIKGEGKQARVFKQKRLAPSARVTRPLTSSMAENYRIATSSSS